MRMVEMAEQHRIGNASPHKTKRAEPKPRPSQKMLREQLLHTLCRRHVDAAQLERFALHGALYSHVMAGMRRHFVLRIHDIYFLVGVVHEPVLGAVLLAPLGRALAGLIIRAFSSTLAVPNLAGPSPIPPPLHSSPEH